MSGPQPYASALSLKLQDQLSPERLSTYVLECSGRLDDAIDLYRWNTAVTGAFWEDIGHLEVGVRNAVDRRLSARHSTLGRAGTWVDDPARELTDKSRDDIDTARRRIRQNRKSVTHGQVVSELSFGFWRFMVSRRLQVLWPDLASGFPHAPNRRRQTVEVPLGRLHDFRNRLAHHQRIWSEPLPGLHTELVSVAGFISPVLSGFIVAGSRVPAILSIRP